MLKYLFNAHYSDGTTYSQNEEEVSVKEPLQRSCFYDVDHSKLKSFELYNRDNSQHYSVNLQDGSFELFVQGQHVHLPSPTEKLHNFRVIFFRRHEADPMTGTDVILTYILGWQANNEEGRNIQRTIEIN